MSEGNARPVTGLDHLLIATADLAAAQAAYERLGFRATPRGRHIGWGTANVCLMFPHDYLELLGIVDPEQFVNNLDRHLETRGEGLLGAALAGEDLDEAARQLRAGGHDVGDPQALERTLDMPDGELRPRFRLLHLPQAATPGLRAFVCKHLTPDLVWQPPFLEHPNGARGIAGLTVVVEDPGTVAVPYAELFGFRRVSNTDGLVSVDCGGCVLRFCDADRLLALHPQARSLTRQPPEGPIAARIEVADKAATARYLERRGVPFARDRDGPLHLAAEEACGVMLDFV